MTTSASPDGSLTRQLDPLLVQQAIELITSAQKIALLAHKNPDGDCLGSILGFSWILRQLGKTCVPVCADPAPANLRFLPGMADLRHTLEGENFDLIIALDAGEFERFGSVYTQHQAYLEQARILNMDHHISSTGVGQVNIIDPTSASTTELLVLFQQQAGLPLNKDAATCLQTGLITDTRSFQFSNTTPRTFQVAALLLATGASPERIVEPLLYAQSFSMVKFQGLVLAQAQIACDGRLVWSWANDDLLAQAGATPEMDDNLAGQMRDIGGVQIAAMLKNYGTTDVTRLSLRCAPPYNAADICQKLANGGGHARAAGATIKLPLREAETYVISELKKIMSK